MPTQKVNNVELYYEQWGEEGALPFLLLHGWTASSFIFKDFGPALAQRYRAIALDLRGHGQSAKPQGEYTTEVFAADIRAFLEALGIEGKIVLYGQSMGGQIALYYTIRYPEAVAKLILDSTSANLMGSWQAWLQWQVFLLFYRLSPEKFFEKMVAGFFHQPPDDPNLLKELTLMSLQMPKATALNAIKHSARTNLTQEVGKIQVPTLITASASDPVSSIREGTERLHQLMPGSQLVLVPDCGHLPFMEQQDFVMEKVIEFVG